MSRLIEDLIDVSRISRGKLELRKEATELTSLVRGVAEATRPVADAMTHDQIVTLPSEPIYVYADPTRLAQAVGNILNNAYKFTERGGRIVLSVEREGEQAVIRVRDSGIGIDAEQLPRIFELFTQVDASIERSRGGLGIGLSLVKDVVDMHGGIVTATSEGLGRGTEFVVRLPILAGMFEPKASQAETAPQAMTPLHILVVDDNHDSAESLALVLRMKGHDVRTVHDGVAAVEEAARSRPDLILLDIGLPGLNGFDVARQIRRQPGAGAIRIVALTGWGQDEYRRRAEEAGFDHHFVKPVAPDDLDRLLAKVSPRPAGSGPPG
jgi:CheY-like chemotaxis protein/anti-sigma regulatory factor (Ser/Thr protein kinase)